MSMKNFPDLAKFAPRKPLVGYPVESQVTLFSPGDNLAGALGSFIDSADYSLSLALANFPDATVATAVLRKLQDPDVFVQLVTDSPEAAGTYSAALLKAADLPSNVVSFGRSEIPLSGTMDGLDSFRGSAREITFTREPLIAFQQRYWIDRTQAAQLTQMKSDLIGKVARAAADEALHAQ